MEGDVLPAPRAAYPSPTPRGPHSRWEAGGARQRRPRVPSSRPSRRGGARTPCRPAGRGGGRWERTLPAPARSPGARAGPAAPRPHLAAAGGGLQHLPVLAPAGGRTGARLLPGRAGAEVRGEENGRELHGARLGRGAGPGLGVPGPGATARPPAALPAPEVTCSQRGAAGARERSGTSEAVARSATAPWRPEGASAPPPPAPGLPGWSRAPRGPGADIVCPGLPPRRTGGQPAPPAAPRARIVPRGRPGAGAAWQWSTPRSCGLWGHGASPNTRGRAAGRAAPGGLRV